jgi:hypothetical protein
MNDEILEVASDVPMRGAEFLRLLVRMGIDPTMVYEITIAANVNAIGERDPIEAIVGSYETDGNVILVDEHGDPRRSRTVTVLRSLEATV